MRGMARFSLKSLNISRHTLGRHIETGRKSTYGSNGYFRVSKVSKAMSK